MQGGKVICGADQYTVTDINGSFSYCLKCDKCHAGYGLYPVCGQTVTHPPSNIGCQPCPNETFSGEYDSGPCHSCHQCAELEIVAAPCTSSSDRICNGTCKKGYFLPRRFFIPASNAHTVVLMEKMRNNQSVSSKASMLQVDTVA